MRKKMNHISGNSYLVKDKFFFYGKREIREKFLSETKIPKKTLIQIHTHHTHTYTHTTNTPHIHTNLHNNNKNENLNTELNISTSCMRSERHVFYFMQ